MNISIDIFGENHTVKERTVIERKIKHLHSIKPFDFILSEEAGDAIAISKEDKQKLIDSKYFSIGPKSYQLGIELEIPVIGIDLWGIHPSIPQETKFTMREKHMLNVIEKYSKLGRIAVLIGDAHLRSVDSEQLGKKSILHVKLYNKLGVRIHRSPNPEK